MAEQEELKVIDWDEAMEQVGGDLEFLNEVLQDLLTESDSAQQEIADAIEAKDFDAIMKAAHRIKGSASYLCCEALKDISLRLQDAGRAGTGTPSDELLEEIKTMFETFKSCLVALKATVAAKSAGEA